MSFIAKAPRPVRSYSTASEDWLEPALQDLLDREVVEIDGCVIDGRKLDPHASTMAQMLHRLLVAGECVPAGMTGAAP